MAVSLRWKSKWDSFSKEWEKRNYAKSLGESTAEEKQDMSKNILVVSLASSEE